MDKKVKIIIAVGIGLLLIGIVSFAIINNSKENKQQETKDSITLNETKLDGNKITQSYELMINNKKKNFTIEYSFNDNTNDNGFVDILGNLLDIEVYSEHLMYHVSNPDNSVSKYKETFFTEEKIKSKINENNFKFIKGEDNKSYLLVVSSNSIETEGYDNYLYLLNDDLKLIKGDFNYDGCGAENAMTIKTDTVSYITNDEAVNKGYTDTFGICQNQSYCSIRVKIEENKIYYLRPNDLKSEEPENNNWGTLEERVYTIKDNKISYTINNKYNITSIAGAIC